MQRRDQLDLSSLVNRRNDRSNATKTHFDMTLAEHCGHLGPATDFDDFDVGDLLPVLIEVV